MPDVRPIRSVRFRGRRYINAMPYLSSGGGSVRCLGWRGHQNLGDEVVFEALERHFAPHRLTWRPEEMPKLLQRTADRVEHPLTILGGGTLIGGRYLDALLAQPDPERRAVFGAGVIDPEFPHSYRSGREALDRWVKGLAEVGYIGVRGPRSKAILSQRGLDAEVLGDPVAAFATDDGFWAPGPNRTVGINVGRSAGGVWGSEIEMLAGLAAAVRKLTAAGWKVEYHVAYPPDLEVTELFARDTNTASSPIHTCYDRAEPFIDRTRHLTAFLGLKLHAVALAVCAGVPAASIEYHPKCRDFMGSLELDHLAINSADLDPDRVVEIVTQLEADGSAISAHGLARLREQRARQQEVARNLMKRFELVA